MGALGGESHYSPCFAHEGTKREGSGTYPSSHILYKVEQGFRSFGFPNPSHSLIIIILPKIKIIISHTFEICVCIEQIYHEYFPIYLNIIQKHND